MTISTSPKEHISKTSPDEPFTILAYVASDVSKLNAEPLPESLLGQIYLVMNWLGHISFLTFMGFVIAIIPLCYLINNSRLVKGLSSTIAALGQAILAFDALLYHRTGLHISWQESELVVDETVQQVATFGTEQLLFFGLLFVVWLSFQLLIANAIWQRIDRFSPGG